MLEKPHEDIDRIGRAIKHLKIESSGTENTMQALRDVVEHYAYVVHKGGRRLLIVLVSDESGDDGTYVEEARQASRNTRCRSMSSAGSRSLAIRSHITSTSIP